MMTGTDLEPRPVPPLPVAVRRRPESLPVRSAVAVWRNPHVSVPLAVPPGLWLAAETAHLLGPVACGSLSSAAVLTFAGVWLEAPRRWPDLPDDEGVLPRWYRRRVWWARASCAGCCGWVPLAAWLGPAGAAWETLLAMLAVGGVVWGVRHHRRRRPMSRRERRRLARDLRNWDAWWQIHAGRWAPGSRVTMVTHEDAQVILRVRLVAGSQVAAGLRQHERFIESALDGMVDAGMVRVADVPGNPGLADVHIKRVDPLAGFVEWEEELAPSSVHDPWPQGKSETGRWRMAPQRTSSFIVGASRSGKSNEELTRIACLSRCPDGRANVIDLKGGRSARPALRACAVEYVITTVAEARDYLLMMATEVKFRAMYAGIGAGASEQLQATGEDPALFTLIDEASELTSLTSGDTSCRRSLAIITAQGMGVECYTDVAAQLGTLEESVGTEQIRSNLPLRMSFRTELARHGAYALGEKTRMDTSLLQPEGTFLTKLRADSPQEKMRGIRMEHDQFAERAASRIDDPPLRLYCGSEPCPVEGYRTWQEWWGGRWGRLPAAFRGDSPQYQRWAAAQPQEEEPAIAETAEPAAPPQPAPSPAPPVMPPAAAPPPAGTQPPAASAPPPVKRAAFAAALQSAAAGTSPAALMAASGLGHTWTARMLDALVRTGAVTKTGRGEYVPVTGADITAAIESVRAGDAETQQRAAGMADDDSPRRLHVV